MGSMRLPIGQAWTAVAGRDDAGTVFLLLAVARALGAAFLFTPGRSTRR